MSGQIVHDATGERRAETSRQPDAGGRGIEAGPSETQVEPLRSIFETDACRDAYGVGYVLRLDVTEGNTPGPLVFRDGGDHAVCLAQTATLDAAAIEQASKALFADSRVRFVVFEDISLDGPVPSAAFTFRYRNDWVVPLNCSQGGIPNSVRRRKDQKLRRLERQHDGIKLVIERAPERKIVEEAIRLSRLKIEAKGRTYLIDEEESDRLVRLSATVGTAAVLYHGDHVVAADLFVENGRDAYIFLGGYDSAYAKESPSMITMRHGIEHFEARGFEKVHLMWGDASYKARLGAIKAPLSTLILARGGTSSLAPAFVTTMARFGLLDMKRRLKDSSWLGEPLRLVQQGFFRLKTMIRREP